MEVLKEAAEEMVGGMREKKKICAMVFGFNALEWAESPPGSGVDRRRQQQQAEAFLTHSSLLDLFGQQFPG